MCRCSPSPLDEYAIRPWTTKVLVGSRPLNAIRPSCQPSWPSSAPLSRTDSSSVPRKSTKVSGPELSKWIVVSEPKWAALGSVRSRSMIIFVMINWADSGLGLGAPQARAGHGAP